MKTESVHYQILLLFTLFFSTANLFAQNDRPSAPIKKPLLTESMTGISTDDNYNATELIKDIFVGGDCFEVSNVNFTGHSSALGYFSNGESSIGFEEGVILATGLISNAEGPNTAANTGQNLNTGSDSDLFAIANQSIHDAAILEFDFTPTTNQVSFQYVFASEEYCEYVGGGFNDAFGFFVSGPGINGSYSNGATNVALIPNTNTNITINTVSYAMNGNYYIDNGPIGQGGSGCTSAEVANEGAATSTLEYDGFTTVLTAVLNVIPCNTYHIKLAIGDGSDGVYDSAVFLKANSFNSGGTAIVSAEVPHTNSENGHESCSDGYFKFTRSATAELDIDLPVHFNLSDLGTATAGIDYSPILTSPVIIPAGENELLIPISLLMDNEEEGEETIILQLEQACTCEDQFVTLTILDTEPLFIETEDLILCEGVDSMITAKVDGGIPGYEYQWNTGETSSNISVPATDFEYIIEVKDVCENIVSETIMVDMKPLPEIIPTVEEVSCAGEQDGVINLSIEKGTAPFIFNWDNDENSQNINQLSGGNYFVTVTDNFQCEAAASFSVFEPVPIQISATKVDVTCYGDSDGQISLEEVVGGRPDYRISFDGSDFQGQSDFNFLPAGVYPIEIEDAYGCLLDTLISIDQPEELVLELGEDAYIELGEFVDIKPSSNYAFEDLNFMWQSEFWFSQDTTLRPLENTAISLMIADENGCSAQDEMRIVVTKPRSVFFPNVFSPNGDGTNDCFYPQAKENVEIIESMQIFDRWGGQVFQQNQILPNDASIGWKGTARGKQLKDGVYIYHAKVRFIDGEVLDVAGDVLIAK